MTSMPVIVQDTLYAGSYDNAVYALDTASGATRWIYEGDGRVYVAPIVDQEVVYAGIGNAGPRICALDAASGQLLWKTATTTDTGAQLLVADGLLYTSDWSGLIGLDPRNSTLVWRYRGLRGVSVLASGSVLYVAANSDDLYAADQSGNLYAFDMPTHQLLWQVTLRPRAAGPATRLKLLGEELYVGFSGPGGRDPFSSIHAVNAQTGREDWSATCGRTSVRSIWCDGVDGMTIVAWGLLRTFSRVNLEKSQVTVEKIQNKVSGLFRELCWNPGLFRTWDWNFRTTCERLRSSQRQKFSIFALQVMGRNHTSVPASITREKPAVLAETREEVHSISAIFQRNVRPFSHNLRKSHWGLFTHMTTARAACRRP